MQQFTVAITFEAEDRHEAEAIALNAVGRLDDYAEVVEWTTFPAGVTAGVEWGGR